MNIDEIKSQTQEYSTAIAKAEEIKTAITQKAIMEYHNTTKEIENKLREINEKYKAVAIEVVRDKVEDVPKCPNCGYRDIDDNIFTEAGVSGIVVYYNHLDSELATWEEIKDYLENDCRFQPKSTQ